MASKTQGAASAAPDLQIYVDLEHSISDTDAEGIRARWEFGRKLSQERVGKKLPKGRLAEVCVAISRGKTEVQFRMRFAEVFPTEEALTNAIGQYGSWLKITQALYTKREAKAEPAKPKKKGPTWGGKTRRKLYDEIREDGATKLRELEVKITTTVMELEHYVLPDDVGLSEEEQDDIGRLFEYLTILSEWTEQALTATGACMDDLGRQRLIKKIRDRMQHPNTPPGEKANCARRIEALEASYRRKRLSSQ